MMVVDEKHTDGVLRCHKCNAVLRFPSKSSLNKNRYYQAILIQHLEKECKVNFLDHAFQNVEPLPSNSSEANSFISGSDYSKI